MTNKTSQEFQTQTLPDLGEQLRQARLSRGFDVETVSEHTRLRPDIIEKIENNQFSSIGAPVYVRGYLTRYALYLGLDESAVQEGYQPSEASNGLGLRLASAGTESQYRPYRRTEWRSLTALVLVIVVCVGLLFELMNDNSWVMRQIHNTFNAQAPQPEKPQIVLQIGADKPPVAQKSADNSAALGLTPVGADTKPAGAPLTLSSTEDLHKADAAAAAAQTPAVLPAPASTPALPLPAATAPAPVSGNIVLKVTGQNWIEIKNAQGKVVASKIYKAGNVLTLPSSDGPYHMNIGRPQQLQLSIDGKTADINQFRGKKAHLFLVGE